MKRRKEKGFKRIKGDHNLDMIDDELYTGRKRNKSKIKKMRYREE